MKSLNKICLVFVLILGVALTSCSKDPTSATATSGNIKITVKKVSAGNLGKIMGSTASFVTITSAKVVIDEIEFESSLGDSLNFKLKEPFVQDIFTLETLQVIEDITVPFGSYKESEFEIDHLDPEDEPTYSQNPDLQGRSILVSGYIDNDTTQTFIFTSNLREKQKREFEPPLVLDENSPSTNIVLAFDMDTWFVDNNGNPLDPRVAGDKSNIERNIKNSFDVFEDKNGDGDGDD